MTATAASRRVVSILESPGHHDVRAVPLGDVLQQLLLDERLAPGANQVVGLLDQRTFVDETVTQQLAAALDTGAPPGYR